MSPETCRRMAIAIIILVSTVIEGRRADSDPYFVPVFYWSGLVPRKAVRTHVVEASWSTELQSEVRIIKPWKSLASLIVTLDQSLAFGFQSFTMASSARRLGCEVESQRFLRDRYRRLSFRGCSLTGLRMADPVPEVASWNGKDWVEETDVDPSIFSIESLEKAADLSDDSTASSVTAQAQDQPASGGTSVPQPRIQKTEVVSIPVRREDPVKAARTELINNLEPLRMGFKATRAQQKEANARIEAFVDQFGGVPRAQVASIEGRWRLVFTDEPSVLRINRTPLAEIDYIGQEYDEGAGTCDSIIMLRPSGRPQALFRTFGRDIADDKLEQRVLLTFKKSSTEFPISVKQKVRGLKFAPQKMLGGLINDDWAPALSGRSLVGVPFGAYQIIYNDGVMRVLKANRGYYGIYVRDRAA